MAEFIAVAGSTGNLGGKIVSALVSRNAKVRALVRPGTSVEKRERLNADGVHDVVEVDLNDSEAVGRAVAGTSVVVSAIQGLQDVIIDTQSVLLDGTAAAGVPRFIPSDYAADFTKTEGEENRNFDMRRAFHRRLDQAPVIANSVLNGMFMDILAYGIPLLDFKAKSVTYWGDPDQLLDFTTTADTAAVTAETALDSAAPRITRVAGDQISARGLWALANELTGDTFQFISAGSIANMGIAIQNVRSQNPGSEGEEFPRWQQMQYMRNMFSGRAKLDPVDNARFPSIAFTTVRDLIGPRFRR
jgi:hypothetical protein